MYATTTAISMLGSTALSLGTLLGLAIAYIFTAWAALTGPSFFKRKVQKYVTGSKF